jgi:hypothetical protein
MATKDNSQWVKISGYLFLLGVLIAVVSGLVGATTIPYSPILLVVLGAIVGLLAALGMGSISREDTEVFMLAAIALIAAGSSGAALAGIPYIGTYLQDIVGGIAALVAPAVVIIALDAIWNVGSEKVL